MEVSALYLYPIKSLRPAAVPSLTLTPTGPLHDRTFMLLRDHGDTPRDGGRYENMHVVYFPALTLFTTSLSLPTSTSPGSIAVTHAPPDGEPSTLSIPLEPDTASLDQITVNMHSSPTPAYAMPPEFSAWFTARLSFPTILAYLGPHRRRVLFGKSSAPEPKSWLSSLSSRSPFAAPPPKSISDHKISFADCAPLLLASATSLADVSSRLTDGHGVDITKFRPNIVVAGAQPWEEDFWASVQLTPADGAEPTVVSLERNCVRCASVNIDYATGKPGEGAVGDVLKVLQRDRRVDPAKKWSPVFGRYGFLVDANGDGWERVVSVGDRVEVKARKAERDVWDWPGL
ncbi:hypothetical protein EJ06DRAFT_536685 [Trichodelitschia bisporula]|uniref:MOSC domain-containing protein n=1 Tax=Trichodelitschia bisporula TaxID=703511 RepID=A0A6G1I2B1_9PEZI|nr:hypothetical protein EJ06DRAFT_536685 [Trichodelitschia bisporula]